MNDGRSRPASTAYIILNLKPYISIDSKNSIYKQIEYKIKKLNFCECVTKTGLGILKRLHNMYLVYFKSKIIPPP